MISAILEAVKQQLLALPDASKDAADLTDAERVALCIASGCKMDYRAEISADGGYRLVASTVNPVGIAKTGQRFQVCELHRHSTRSERMNDPTNWNPDVDTGYFEFASPAEAKRAEGTLNKAMRESYEAGLAAGRNEAERLVAAQKLVDKQAEDAGLWFAATTAPEGYLQAALRELHAVIQGDSWFAPEEK